MIPEQQKLATTRDAPVFALSAGDVALLLSFLVSGCCALIYQVSWQRALYAVVGVDVDSMTIIISVFMLGIGIGGALGGWLADRYPTRRMLIYGVAEMSIALYGAASLLALQGLEGLMATTMFGSNRLLGSILCFVFFLVPTLLMGMTLPVLTLTFNEQRHNIGVSVGTLYFVNTLGAALGAMAVPFVLLPLLPLSQVIFVAVAGNCAVVMLVLLARAMRKAQTQ